MGSAPEAMILLSLAPLARPLDPGNTLQTRD